uniref:Triacylglycerol lipase n=1 Tax=Naja naja TaxID=35670 RepID=A0A8C6X853_NAJNA
MNEFWGKNMNEIDCFQTLLCIPLANEVCYEKIGCFSDKPPWSGIPGRQLFGLPASPEKMNISFSLFTKETGNLSQRILYNELSSLQNSSFSPLRKTRFVIHGYTSTGKYDFLILRGKADINCFVVDWEDGAKCTYFIAGSNIRVLGAVIAKFIITMMKIYQYHPSNVHLIGHSLGAHTAGEAGRRLQYVRLDPAAIGFEGFPEMVRLDPSDAGFVDVIHTNGARFPFGLGMFNATGDMDFYPNGGKFMVGCNDEKQEQEDIHSVGNCHHSRSYKYYKYSILYPSGFLAYPCKSYKSFQAGNCFPCPTKSCPVMGHYADQSHDKLKKSNQNYYLNTGFKEPFTSWRYNLSVKLNGMKNVKGEVYIVFHNKNGDMKEYPIMRGSLKQEQIYSKLTDVEINPENASRIEFVWHKQFFTFFWAQLGAEKVNLTRGQDGRETSFCGHGTVKYEVPQMLTPC